MNSGYQALSPIFRTGLGTRLGLLFVDNTSYLSIVSPAVQRLCVFTGIPTPFYLTWSIQILRSYCRHHCTTANVCNLGESACRVKVTKKLHVMQQSHTLNLVSRVLCVKVKCYPSTTLPTFETVFLFNLIPHLFTYLCHLAVYTMHRSTLSVMHMMLGHD